MLNPLLAEMLQRSKRKGVARVKSLVLATGAGRPRATPSRHFDRSSYSLAPSALPSAIQAVAVAARAVRADCCALRAASVASSA